MRANGRRALPCGIRVNATLEVSIHPRELKDSVTEADTGMAWHLDCIEDEPAAWTCVLSS